MYKLRTSLKKDDVIKINQITQEVDYGISEVSKTKLHGRYNSSKLGKELKKKKPEAFLHSNKVWKKESFKS